MKGVPLRLELGPKDMEKSVVSYARRDSGEKGTIPVAELATQVPALLEQIQKDMYEKAEKNFAEHRLVINEWEKVVPALNSKNLVIIPFCEEVACEERIKEITKSEGEQRELGPDGKPQPTMGMKSLCIPFDQVCDPSAVSPGLRTLANSACSPRAWSRERPSVSTPSAGRTRRRGSCLAAAIKHINQTVASQHVWEEASGA